MAFFFFDLANPRFYQVKDYSLRTFYHQMNSSASFENSFLNQIYSRLMNYLIRLRFDLLFMNFANPLTPPEMMPLITNEKVVVFNFKNKLHSSQIKKWGNQFSPSFIDQNVEKNNHSQQSYIYFAFFLGNQQIIRI